MKNKLASCAQQLEQKLTMLDVRWNLSQLYLAKQVIHDLQAVVAGELTIEQLIEYRRYLLELNGMALRKKINNHKTKHELSAATCKKLLAELEEIDNDETE